MIEKKEIFVVIGLEEEWDKEGGLIFGSLADAENSILKSEKDNCIIKKKYIFLGEEE